MYRDRRAALLLGMVAIIVSAAPLGAQVTVSGKVLDENNGPVREVRIAVAALDGVTLQAATSDPAGDFHLDIPAAGVYRVRAESEGFFLFTSPGISLGNEFPLEIHLNHLKEMAESVDVNYSAPVIDPEQTSDTRRLNNQEILNIPYPSSQDFRAALPLMPGVLFDSNNQLHFNGGNTSETSFRLNGFEVSDPATGALTARLNVDTVQTVEWDVSRFSADKGKGSAGLLDIKTEMGDNHWRFGGTNFIPGFGSQDGIHLDHWSPRVKFSGPLVKSRLWFHNAFDTYYTVSTVSSLPKGNNRATSVSGSNLTRLQWNVTNAQILTFSLLVNRSNDQRNGLSFLNPAETTLNRRDSLYLGAVKDQWTVGGGLIEFGFADTRKYLRASPQGDQTYVQTPFGSRGNFFADQSTSTGRQEWLANGFVRPLRFHGSHQIRIGADVERSDIDQTVFRHEYSSVRADNTPVRSVQFLGSPQQFKNNLEAYGYVQDRWSPFDGLMFEGGFRTQWNEYTGSAPFAPRLAAAWSPHWAGGARFSAGWGIFYDAVTLNMLALSQEQDSVSTFFGPDGAISAGPVVTRFVLNPKDLRLPRFALSSFSADRKLPWQLFAKVNLISREGSRGFTFEDTAAGPALNLYVLDNIQRQRYRSAEFALRRTFLAKYQWFASFTRSEARANAVINYSVENPLFSPQAGGTLPWDAPNRFLAWAWAPVEKAWFPHFMAPLIGETDIQLQADYRTGLPFSVTNDSGNLVGAPDSRRFPSYGTVNIAFERRFPFRGYLWAWRVGLINALDRANPNVVNSDVDSPQFLTYARGQRRAVNVRLRFLGKK